MTAHGAPVVGDVPLGMSDIADLLDVHVQTVKKWRTRDRLPAPDGRIGRSDWWWQSTILRWQQP